MLCLCRDKQEAERIHADRVKRGLEEDPAEAVVEDSDDDDDGEKLQKQRAKDDWKDGMLFALSFLFFSFAAVS